MKRIFSALLSLFVFETAAGQQEVTQGIVTDSISKQPIAGVTILVSSSGLFTMSAEDGRFTCRGQANDAFTFSATGFRAKKVLCNAADGFLIVRLTPMQVKLADVVITAWAASPYKALMETSIAMRGVSNSQEVLRMVPGLFIGQHQGGGKAEQIFLRGFDADHGHDILLSADGMPINMVSHAHGQGYADSHFIIAETIEKAIFNKGPYDAEKGDLATAGYLDFQTFNSIKNSVVKVEGGQFGTFRALALVNLLSPKRQHPRSSWYAASEYAYTNGYFDNPEHFKRFNIFTKFDLTISEHRRLTVSASTFYSSWLASSQIPERAIDSGYVGYYGALDASEGGVTTRTNINAKLQTSLPNGGLLKNQVYYSRYKFDLHSNFTYFLEDTANGDQIRQQEHRNLFGYTGSYQQDLEIGTTRLSSLYGVNIRLDATSNSSLFHTIDRYTLLNAVKLGNITEFSCGLYLRQSLRISSKWLITAGLRIDQFYYRYKNLLPADTAFPRIGTYHANNRIVSPKISIFYQQNARTQWYVSTGKGFHSNDARVVLAAGKRQTLPAAYAADLGLVYKPVSNILLQAAAWTIFLEKEYVYGGDGGSVEFSGRTRRIGFDVSARWEIFRVLFFDADINYALGRSTDDVKGKNYIPGAPVWSSSGGATLNNASGWSASLRYRYLSPRPANADYSLQCAPYFISDLVVKYRHKGFEYGLVINNLFDVRWRETQLAAVTRLRNDPSPVDGLSFTPGTPFAGKLTFSYFF